MNNSSDDHPTTLIVLLSAGQLAGLQDGRRVRQRPANTRSAQQVWAADTSLDDTITELEGVARNPNPTGT